MDRIRIGVLGASGYTGADLVRLAARHPNLQIAALNGYATAGGGHGFTPLRPQRPAFRRQVSMTPHL